MVFTILYDFSIYYWITTGGIIIMNGNEMKKNNIIRYKTTSPNKNSGKAFQHMGSANKKFNQALAKTILSMPIPMKYETWSFLHEIADGDD